MSASASAAPRRAMDRLYATVKRQALRHLPRPLLQALKRRHYVRALAAASADDEPELRVVRELVSPGDTVLDVGANMGLYTRLLSEWVGPRGTVISVEPVPDTFALLASNVRALSLSNVRPVHAAASDREGELVMEVPRYDEGGENFYQSHVVPDGGRNGGPGAGRRVRVRAVTLDGLLEGRAAAFVKCDVEGHELACLAGAEALLRDSRPALLVEVSGDPGVAGSSAARVFGWMGEMEYGAWRYDGARLHPRRAGERSVNWFFLTAEQAARLRSRAPALFGGEETG